MGLHVTLCAPVSSESRPDGGSGPSEFMVTADMVEERDVADMHEQRPETLSGPTCHDSPERPQRRQPEEQSSHSEPLASRYAVSKTNTEPASMYKTDPLSAGKAPTSRSKRRQPDYSLAGPPANSPSSGVYVDPMYRKLNPSYGKEEQEPIWGLAKPFPRVVRSGMRQDDGKEVYEPPEKGEAEAVPQLDNIPGSTEEEEGAQPTDQEGAPHEQAVCKPEEDRVPRPVETEARDWSKAPEETEKQAEPEKEEFFNKWAQIRHYLREPLAEFLGTTVSLLIGLCGNLAVTTSKNQGGSKLSENWAWGLGFMVGIYLAGGVSGAHLNPVISITLWIFRGFPLRRCYYYITAQILGAITAAGLAYCLYRDAIISQTPGVPPNTTGFGFYSEPLIYISGATGFFNEFVGTAMLLCTILALGDDSNAPPGAGMHSLIIGLVITVLSICLSYNTGGSFNPVRDFGPRLVTLMAGYGGHVFTDRSCWWIWGPWIATTSGGIIGAAVYDIFIFIGGESPVNYPKKRRMRAKLKKQAKWRKRLRLGTHKVKDIEEGIEKTESK
ncbi:aquaporin, putative [Paecilomyces variotii No. 5]|uniref:Aquaporin, putative n=1 Tax=Byssochlamys spectabilis (strain No. 5 / NBRC 109023) TaxID=1356009 RepID=V5FP78_BYSSN|nr:aquaporin, putative [Paecilomyces variotii No. 5]